MSFLIDRSSLIRGWGSYIIMHKNKNVASINEDGTVEIYNHKFMPYNLWFEKDNDIDIRVNNLNNFYYWCSSRILTLDRKYAKEILNAIGAKQAITDRDRAMIAISYHALCLTDVYWVRNINENISFDDISLYRHSLSGAFVDVSLLGKKLTVQNTELLSGIEVASDISTNGVSPKAWVRQDDIFYLLKNGDERDVKAEILASKIVNCFNVPHVEYTSDVFSGRNVSKCRLITDENFSIISAEYIDIYCMNIGTNLDKYVLEKDKYCFYMMNIIDYLVGNSDRHWGNWGFIVDNNTNDILRLHPLMDFNKAFTNYDNIDGGNCQTVSEFISQKDSAIIAVKEVGLNMIHNVSKDWFYDISICEMFNKRLKILLSV